MRVGVSLLALCPRSQPRQAEALRLCLESLLASDLAAFDWKLVVVDQGSDCDAAVACLQELEATQERAEVVWLDGNAGIARGRNLAWQKLAPWGPDFVLEVHADMAFPQRTPWITPLLQALEGERGARLAHLSPRICTSGGEWRSATLPARYPPEDIRSPDPGRFLAALDSLAERHRGSTEIRPGLCHPALLRVTAVEAVSDGTGLPYDEDLPGEQNFEDTELAYRLVRGGWLLGVHQGSMAFHHYTFTRLEVGDNIAAYNANYAHCLRKHGADFGRFATRVIGAWMETAISDHRLPKIRVPIL